jgi:hypothetical protein
MNVRPNKGAAAIAGTRKQLICAGKLIVARLASAYSRLLIACRTPMNFLHFQPVLEVAKKHVK